LASEIVTPLPDPVIARTSLLNYALQDKITNKVIEWLLNRLTDDHHRPPATLSEYSSDPQDSFFVSVLLIIDRQPHNTQIPAARIEQLSSMLGKSNLRMKLN